MSTRVHIVPMLSDTAAEIDQPVTLPTFECTRCGHSWHPAKPERPRRCAGCKSPYWDRPRVYRKSGTSRSQSRRRKPSKS